MTILQKDLLGHNLKTSKVASNKSRAVTEIWLSVFLKAKPTTELATQLIISLAKAGKNFQPLELILTI
jgi:hypothetical protein